MGFEIVHRQLDRLPLFELLDVFDHQLRVQRIRVVEIDDFALGDGQVLEILVVGIVRQVGDMLCADPAQDHVGNRGFSGTCPTGNTDG